MFQPIVFHNLHHEMVFNISTAILMVASFLYSLAWGLYFHNTNRGKLLSIFMLQYHLN